MHRIRRRNRSKARAHRAFTLIELLVVITVIGVLASLSLAAVGAVQTRGRTARTVSDLRQIGTMVLAFAADHDGQTPTPGGSIAYGQTDSSTGLPSWQEQLEQTSGRFERKLFAGPEPERLPSGEWLSHYFLGTQAAYADTGAFGPVRLHRLAAPARYPLVGEVRVPGMFSPQDADRDNYTQDPAFDGSGKAKPANQLFFADGHVAAVATLAGSGVLTTYDEAAVPTPGPTP